MSQQPYSPISEDEAFLRNCINFIVDSWKTIILTSLLGIVGSYVYLGVTPNQYQATALINVAQISDSSSYFLGVNVEEPILLVNRLKLPTTYSSQEIKACGLENTKNPLEALVNILKISVPTATGSLIELKIISDDRDVALACAQSVFETIKASQNAIVKPTIETAKNLLIKYQDRVNNTYSLNPTSHKSNSDLSSAYLANRDELQFLLQEIFRLNNFIVSGETKGARLTSPIYVSDRPVAPNKRIVLIAGLFLGMFLGFLVMIGKRMLGFYSTN